MDCIKKNEWQNQRPDPCSLSRWHAKGQALPGKHRANAQLRKPCASRLDCFLRFKPLRQVDLNTVQFPKGKGKIKGR